jgi:hypothetical protein
MSLPALDVMAVLADLQQQLTDLAGVVDAQQRTLQQLLAGTHASQGWRVCAAGTDTCTAAALRAARTAGPPAVPGTAG